MSSSPALPDPADRASQRDEDAQYYRQVLHELVEIGSRLARAIDRQATPETNAAPAAPEQAAQPAPAAAAAPQLAIAFDRIARTIRRTIALARTLTDPVPPSPTERATAQAAARRRLARKQIIRTVEDCIQRETSGREAEALHAELYERLETIDADDDIDTLPVAEIIALIRRDLGIANLPGTHPWKRRRPADVRELCARAAKPSAWERAGDRPVDRTGPSLPFSAPHRPTRTSTGPPRP